MAVSLYEVIREFSIRSSIITDSDINLAKIPIVINELNTPKNIANTSLIFTYSI